MIIGFFCIVLASVAFGIGPVFVKELMACGLNTTDILIFPRVVALTAIGVILLISRISLRVTKTQFWQLILFAGCSNGLTAALLISSYRFLPIGFATMFHFIYPVVVTVFMAVFYKEKLSAAKVISIAMAITGLCLILDLSGSMSLPGVALALSSGFTYAVYVIANKKSAYKGLPALVVVFYSSLIALIGTFLFQLADGLPAIPSEGRQWLLITANGLISNLLAFLMLIFGIRRIGASNAAVANMMEPMTALVAGIVIYGDIIELKAIFGCIIVMLAITLIAVKKRYPNPE